MNKERTLSLVRLTLLTAGIKIGKANNMIPAESRKSDSIKLVLVLVR